MRNSIRIIAMLLALNILSAMFFTDVKAAPEAISNELLILQSMDFFSNNLKPDDKLLRGEFAMLISKMIDIDNNYSVDSNILYFEDVPNNRLDFSAISKLNELNIMKGSGKLFNPEQPISLEQVSKVMVSVLKYGSLADDMGGYPSGYMKMATQLGMLKEVSAGYEDSITVSVAAKIIYIAMRIKMFDPLNNKISDQTIAQQYMGIYSNIGILMGTYYVNITNTSLSRNRIMLDNKIYECEKNFDMLVGHKVEYFYKQDKSTDDIKVIAIRSLTNNKELTVDSRNLIKSGSSSKLTYENIEGKSIDVKIKLPFVVVNGSRTDEFNLADIYPTIGQIRFLDNNGDDVYEYAFVQKIDNLVVSNVTANVISDRYGKPNIDISPESKKDVFFYKDGNSVLKSSISKNNVVSVESGKNYTKVYISTRTENGVISEKGNDDKGTIYVINGFPYLLDQSYQFN